MDFNFSETQGMLRDTLRRYLADNYDFDKRVAMLKHDGGRDPGVWKALAQELGILGAALYSPVFTSAIGNMRDFTLALACFVALMAWKASPWLVVLLAALGGIVLTLLS